MFLQLSKLLSVLICCLLVTTSLQYDFPLLENPTPVGPLGIKLDYNFAIRDSEPDSRRKPGRPWFFSSRLRFNQPVDTIRDAVLWGLLFEAQEELGPALQQYGISPKTVDVMTLMAFDHEIIFASSVKKFSFAYAVGDTPVTGQLQICQADFHEETGYNEQHSNKAQCGEIMAAQLYNKAHPGADITISGARFGTVMVIPGTGGRVDRRAPCSGDRENKPTWGCERYMNDNNLKELNPVFKDRWEAYDLRTLAGGLVTGAGIQNPDQVLLC
ncbi:hypothetical protein QBC34DRAFT_377209 [Podospora aff. communis PSN243]|uniref:Uncharacterized protein n=1 Tax=Podospora aff. communis PSN243 TaxID=3040156 RepID=A0AAV9GXS0_9PEZI|nr:hypothetical protein QBC34DRAFT_377209 [Podospora aff. communis PSN243]